MQIVSTLRKSALRWSIFYMTASPSRFNIPPPIDVPVVLHFRCDACSRATGTARPLLILVQGALARPEYYSRLARLLARLNFIVAIPDYTSRDLFNISPVFDTLKKHVLSTRKQGFDCPINGQFATTKLITRYSCCDAANSEIPHETSICSE